MTGLEPHIKKVLFSVATIVANSLQVTICVCACAEEEERNKEIERQRDVNK